MNLDVLIITGQSGSGKSTAARALEDQGYYVVDNLPTSFIDELIHVLEAEHQYTRLALVLDVRNRRSLEEGPALVANLRKEREKLRVFYLEADEESLLRRYSETRRAHPLDRGQGLRAALSAERELLTPMREVADDTFDTSGLSPHELKTRFIESLARASAPLGLRFEIQSFGFKYGAPLDADMVLDVRFLPNPYFEPTLRDQSGLDPEVREFILAEPDAHEFLSRSGYLLEFLIPLYQAERKSYFTLGIGCTGGRHRSVVISRAIADKLESIGHRVTIKHRDLPESS